MMNLIESFRPYLGQTVYVRTGAYDTPLADFSSYEANRYIVRGTLKTVLIDDSFVVKCVVECYGEVEQHRAEHVHTSLPWANDDESFGPEADYDERYNYAFGSSATGITEQA